MNSRLVYAVVIHLSIFTLLLTGCSAPKAIFSIPAEEPKAPVKITFENASENAERYEWDFGDGNISNDPSPTHRYTSSGNYAVTLKAFKDKKVKSTTKNLQVTAPDACLIELTTDYGAMLIELYDETPAHRDNFSKLADEGFFDNLLFHRVMGGFMIQGGDPTSKGAAPKARLGTGGPGYTVPQEISPSLHHVKGALAAARQPDQVNPKKASSGSQFYIVQGKEVTEDLLDKIERRNNISYTPEQRKEYIKHGGYPPLDGEYTIFGRVVEGLDVIDKIAESKTDRFDRPLTDISMKVLLIK